MVVRIYGPDLDVLRAKAEQAGNVMAAIEGVTDLKVEQQVLIPKVEIQYLPDAAGQFGLRSFSGSINNSRHAIGKVSTAHELKIPSAFPDSA